MNTEELLDYDDLGDALREGRALRPARGYRFRFAQGDLNFQSRQVSDPVPLGRQLLEAGGLGPAGRLQPVRHPALGRLRGRAAERALRPARAGAERFVAFLTDRDFKLTLNDRRAALGQAGHQRHAALRPRQALATGEGVFLEVRGGEDRLIEPGELIDLTQPGIERFITARLTFEIIVNSRPRTVNAPTRSRSSRSCSLPSRASTIPTSSSR